jgi:hypothetical protein
MARIQVDVINGILDIEASEEALEAATQYAIKLLETARQAKPAKSSSPLASVENASEEEADAVGADAPPPRKRKRGGGKTKNWQNIPTLLKNEDWKYITDFFAQKSPKTQNEQVAVICRGLSERLDRNGFDGNEIHTVYNGLGKKTPSSLTGVMGNMAVEGLGHTTDGKFQLGFRGEQLVDHDLPRAIGKDE